MALTSQTPALPTLQQDVETLWGEWVTSYFDGAHTNGTDGIDGVASDQRAVPQCELLIGQAAPKSEDGRPRIQLIFSESYASSKQWEDKRGYSKQESVWTMTVIVEVPVQGGRGSVNPRWEARWVASVFKNFLEREDQVPYEDLVMAGIRGLRSSGLGELPVPGMRSFQQVVRFRTRA